MQQITFYLLQSSSAQSGGRFLCRLAQKVYAKQSALDIACETSEQATELNQTLWTFETESFIPHQINAQNNQEIQIRTLQTLDKSADLLLNLSPDLNTDNTHYQRILQCVFDNAEHKQQSRILYKKLQALGWQIETHNITA